MALKDLSTCRYQTINETMKGSIETGFIDYDRHVYDLKPEEITILFGRDGEGKSTVASQMLAHHINRGRRAYLFSGELSPDKIQKWLYRQIVGDKKECYTTVKTKYGYIVELKAEVVKAIKKWHEARLFIHEAQIKNGTDNEIYEDIKNAAAIGIDFFVIDNLMTAFEANAITQYADQSNFVQKCKELAIKYKIHILIVCHPNKTEDELDTEAKKGNLTKKDISGSKNISNKADNIISIERIFKYNEDKKENKTNKKVYVPETKESVPDMLMTSLKDRFDGGRLVTAYSFHGASGRFYNTHTPKNVNYGWEKFL